MMEPLDPLSQLAMCCGLGRRRRPAGLELATGPSRPGAYYYSPSMAHMSPQAVNWSLLAGVNQLGAQQQQPYLLLTQPVILANPNQGLQAPSNPYQALALIGAQPAGGQQTVANIAASQYAIYNAAPAILPATSAQAAATIYERPQRQLVRNQSALLASDEPIRQANPAELTSTSTSTARLQPKPRRMGLNSDIFKRLEALERQVDLSRDMELIERFGIVITRALEPSSLMPHLTEATLAQYQSQCLRQGGEQVVRFIEIIKRPGQTLGLYIRAVHFEGQQQARREGLVITKIESDSPIYSSQVLHVGDEILSINLVDVQNMSLDDVVVLMSVPKRLVLALRIPRERDQLLRTNLMQQQLLPRSFIEQAAGQQVVAELPRRGSLQRQRNLDLPMMRPNSAQIQLRAEQVPRPDPAAPLQSGPIQVQQAALGLGQPDPTLYHARRVRVQSALHLNEVLNGKVPNNQLLADDIDVETAAAGRLLAESDPDALRCSNSINRQLLGNNNDPDFDKSLLADLRSATSADLGEFLNNLHGEQRPMEQIDRQIAISKSIADDEQLHHHHAGPSERFQNFALDSEIAKLEREAMNKSGPYTMFEETALGGPNQRMPSTLPRRTLPTRPDQLAAASPPMLTFATSSSSSPVTTATTNAATATTRQPIIGALRLGQTPEQSSYFSSSIDAINRELKELRRQRMAISNNSETGAPPTDSLSSDHNRSEFS